MVAAAMTFLMVTAAAMALFMVAAAMVAAGMIFTVMVVAICTGRYKLTFQISLYSLIRISLGAGNQFHSGLSKGCLSAAANPSADQHIDLMVCQKSG